MNYSESKIMKKETPKIKQIANLTKFIHKMSSKRENPNRFRLYDITGISPTISCMEGGFRTTNTIRNER